MLVNPTDITQIAVDLPYDEEGVILDLYADLHTGHVLFQRELFERHWEQTVDGRNRYAVFLGDLFQAQIAGAKGTLRDRAMDADQEFKYLAETLALGADKILAVVRGNHEERILRQGDIDVLAHLTDHLGLTERYGPHGALLRVHQAGRAYTGYLYHGSTDSDTALYRAASIADADFYASGHTHRPKVLTDRFTRWNWTIDRLFIVTGAYQGYGGYAQDKSMRQTKLGRLTVLLQPEGVQVLV